MPSVPIISSGNNGQGASSTSYAPIVNGSLLGSSNESLRSTIVRQEGTYSNIYLVISANATTDNTQIRFRKNLADGNQNFLIGAGLTGEFEGDLVNSDTVIAGDTVSIQTITAVGGNLTQRVQNVRFQATNNAKTVTFLGSIGLLNISSASIADTQFLSVLGRAAFEGSATEANAQAKINTDGVLKNFYLVVQNNSRTNDTILKLRKNGAFGNITVTIPAGLTGEFEDTTHTDNVSVGDLICLSYSTGTGTDLLQIQEMVLQFETTDGAYVMQALGDGASLALADAATAYFNFGANATTITESNFRADLNVAANISKLWCYVSANATTSPSTLALRKNGADANQVISIGAGLTGAFESPNSDSFLASDEINLKAVNGGGGALTMKSVTALFKTPSTGAIFLMGEGLT